MYSTMQEVKEKVKDTNDKTLSPKKTEKKNQWVNAMTDKKVLFQTFTHKRNFNYVIIF